MKWQIFETSCNCCLRNQSLGSKEETILHLIWIATHRSHYFPSLSVRRDMEQFFLVPGSVDNKKSLNNQTVTKQELRKYQVEQNSTYQIVSLKKESNKKLFAKADALVGKFLSCLRIKLSNSQISLEWVEAATLQSKLAQQLLCTNTEVPERCFTWCCWCISNSGCKSKCHSRREMQLRAFQNMNVSSCKECSGRAVLLMCLCAI